MLEIRSKVGKGYRETFGIIEMFYVLVMMPKYIHLWKSIKLYVLSF